MPFIEGGDMLVGFIIIVQCFIAFAKRRLKTMIQLLHLVIVQFTVKSDSGRNMKQVMY